MRIGENIEAPDLQQERSMTDPGQRRFSAVSLQPCDVGLELVEVIAAFGYFRQPVAPTISLPSPETAMRCGGIIVAETFGRMMRLFRILHGMAQGRIDGTIVSGAMHTVVVKI